MILEWMSIFVNVLSICYQQDSEKKKNQSLKNVCYILFGSSKILALLDRMPSYFFPVNQLSFFCPVQWNLRITRPSVQQDIFRALYHNNNVHVAYFRHVMSVQGSKLTGARCPRHRDFAPGTEIFETQCPAGTGQKRLCLSLDIYPGTVILGRAQLVQPRCPEGTGQKKRLSLSPVSV